MDKGSCLCHKAHNFVSWFCRNIKFQNSNSEKTQSNRTWPYIHIMKLPIIANPSVHKPTAHHPWVMVESLSYTETRLTFYFCLVKIIGIFNYRLTLTRFWLLCRTMLLIKFIINKVTKLLVLLLYSVS